MAYDKQTWENVPSTNTPLSAARLNHIEDGIGDAHDALDGKADATHTHVLADVTDVVATAAEVNVLSGVTVSTEELNALDGVTSGVQSQLDGKAEASHTHAASAVTSGTLDIARIPVGNSGSTVCAGNDSRLSDQRTPLDGSVTLGKIADNAITNAKISTGAAIAVSKLGVGRVQAYANGVATSREIDVLNETQWAAVSSPTADRVYLVFED
ncbi:minor tail protein [Mycobacterium phage Frankie]|nr:minor tail protein [Mycobacterium phage Frankie]